MIIDTHVHYDDKAFDKDREELLSGLSSHDIGIVVDIGADIESSKKAVELSKKYDYIYSVIGIHPSETKGITEDDMGILKRLIFEKTVAVGEIGLDYHWAENEEEKVNQKKWFVRQIKLAKEVGLPIVIHSRDAAEDTMRIVKEEKAYECGGVVHCYSYSPEQAKEYVKMGFYLGVGGVVTYKNGKKLKETVAQTDLSNIVLETDCPYLSPEPHRGKRNDSTNLRFVIQEIAALKGVSEDAVVQATAKNAIKLYNLKSLN
ncbi:MAG: TatD family hydrolase [Eubacterium sp.]|nr:TatD family hydrolase [Eubacterium sp.]